MTNYMSELESKTLKLFNPCPDRVDSIQKHLINTLDEKSTADLFDHIELCRKCKGYYKYLEGIERSLFNASISLSKETSFNLKSIEPTLQEVAMRSLTMWTLQVVQNVIYKRGIAHKYFIDPLDLISIDRCLRMSKNIIRSFTKMETSPKSNLRLISELDFSLDQIQHNESKTPITSFSNHDDLLDSLKVCLKLNPEDVNIYIFCNQIYINLSRFDDASSFLLNPSRDEVSHTNKSLLLNELAAIYYFSNKTTNAIDTYYNALDKFEYPFIHLNLGMALLENQRLSDALNHFRLSCSKNSTSKNELQIINKAIIHNYHKHENEIKSHSGLLAFFNKHRTISQ